LIIHFEISTLFLIEIQKNGISNFIVCNNRYINNILSELLNPAKLQKTRE